MVFVLVSLREGAQLSAHLGPRAGARIAHAGQVTPLPQPFHSMGLNDFIHPDPVYRVEGLVLVLPMMDDVVPAGSTYGKGCKEASNPLGRASITPKPPDPGEGEA